MFSLIDIAYMHRDQRHKSLYEKCDVRTCNTERLFKKRYGSVPVEQCDFTKAFNGVISSIGDEVKTYVIGTTLWAFEEDRHLSTSSRVNLLLMLYVFSKHCGKRYEEITTMGYWSRDYGDIILMPVSIISKVTLDSIAYSYIGYAKGNDTWETAKGTNNSILYEAVAYFKHSSKYRDILLNFEYELTQKKPIARFEEVEASNYPIVREANNYLSAPVKFGGREYEQITVDYISDIHIRHHIDSEKPVLPQVRNMVKELVKSQQGGIVFFGGDTAVDRGLCALFYKEYMLRRQFLLYKDWKERNVYRPAMSEEEAKAEYERRLNKLQKKRDEEIKRIKPWLEYTKSLEEMGAYGMDLYIESAYYVQKHYPDFIALRLRRIKKIEHHIHELIINKDSFLANLQEGHGDKTYQKVEIRNVFAVLGNHEMADFNTVKDANLYYSQLFLRLGICFLDNNVLSTEKFVIFGGCGFAKYNLTFNAINTLNARRFTREDEIEETNRFEEKYHEALDKAKAERKPLLVLAHYPTEDWLENDQCDSQAVYFTGHTHRNTSECTEQRYIYSDNQIGYERKSIFFKTARLGTIQNPFIDYEDGCFEITTDQYCDYYRYCGDPLSGTSFINNVLRQGGRFFMIKHFGFYGFFTQNRSLGISICVGGKTRKIPRAYTISYLMENFDAMVSAYLTTVMPFRRAQEQISAEVQSLGLSGRIHGCIVDVDYYNHIMLNPLDGAISYYYSPVFGKLRLYKTFAELLENIDSDTLVGEQKRNILEDYALMATSKCLLSEESFVTSDEVGKLVTIEISGSVYSMSSRINQLQRLFTSRVLRDWNPELIDKQKRKQNLLKNGS